MNMSSVAASQSSLPPDVVFAQKASAVVKAAGYDPRTMDLDLFLNVAHDVFLNANTAIYKESIEGVIPNAVTEADKSSNCQRLINSLYQRTGNVALSTISGGDIVTKQHHAIGIVVGVLFSEGQRMWLAKQSSVQTSTKDGDASLASKKKKKTKNAKTNYSSQVNTDLPSNIADALPVVSSAALDGIIDRIKYLEKRLNKPTQFMDPQDVQFVKKAPKSIDKAAQLQAFVGRTQSNSSQPEENRPIQEPENQTAQPKKAKRPTSAPASRPKSASAAPGSVFSRLAQPPPAPNPTDAAAEPQPKAKLPPGQAASNIESGVEYIYDINGHRIAVTEEYRRKKEHEAFEARLKAEKGDTSAAESTENGHKHHKFQSFQPTIGVQPFKKSVEEWVARARKDLEEKKRQETLQSNIAAGKCASSASSSSSSNSNCRQYALYHMLETQDILISVEHCHSCESHKITLRHKSDEYSRYADSMLRLCAEVIHDLHLAVRIGLAKVKAVVTNKSANDGNMPPIPPPSSSAGISGHAPVAAVECRIGACEIQIAYRDAKGHVHVDILHSKLSTGHWPSKSVVTKRLISFANKNFIPVFEFSGQREWEASNSSKKSGIDTSYPIGSGPFADLSIGPESWSFPSHTVSDMDCNDDFFSAGVYFVVDSRRKPVVKYLSPSPRNLPSNHGNAVAAAATELASRLDTERSGNSTPRIPHTNPATAATKTTAPPATATATATAPALVVPPLATKPASSTTTSSGARKASTATAASSAVNSATTANNANNNNNVCSRKASNKDNIGSNDAKAATAATLPPTTSKTIDITKENNATDTSASQQQPQQPQPAKTVSETIASTVAVAMEEAEAKSPRSGLNVSPSSKKNSSPSKASSSQKDTNTIAVVTTAEVADQKECKQNDSASPEQIVESPVKQDQPAEQVSDNSSNASSQPIRLPWKPVPPIVYIPEAVSSTELLPAIDPNYSLSNYNNDNETLVKTVLKSQLHSQMEGGYWNCCWDWDVDMPLSHWSCIVMDSSVGSLTHNCVTELLLSDAGLTGILATPSIRISDLRSLTIIDMSRNNIDGPLPREFSYLSNLMSLNLSHNNFNGHLPVEYCRLTQLSKLDVSNNKLTGSVPAQYCQLTSLNILKLHGNDLNGPLPPSLVCLSLSLSNFTSNLYPYRDMEVLSRWLHAQSTFEWSSLSLGCSEEQLDALMVLFASVDRYSAAADDPPLLTVDSGAINDPFGYLNTGDDDDDGDDIFELLDKMDKKVAIASPVPASTDPAPSIKQPSPNKDKSKSKGTAEIARAASESVDAALLDPWRNWNHRDMPLQQWAGITTNARGCIQSISRRRLHIGGIVPAELSACRELVYLDLSQNKIAEGLNDQLRQCNSIRYLYLENNCLNGTIWSVICGLYELEVINVSDNQLTENISEDIIRLTKLREFRVRNNMIAGHLPKCLFHLPQIEVIDASANELSGDISSSKGDPPIPSTLQSVRLSDNPHLHGMIGLGHVVRDVHVENTRLTVVAAGSL